MHKNMKTCGRCKIKLSKDDLTAYKTDALPKDVWCIKCRKCHECGKDLHDEVNIGSGRKYVEMYRLPVQKIKGKVELYCHECPVWPDKLYHDIQDERNKDLIYTAILQLAKFNLMENSMLGVLKALVNILPSRERIDEEIKENSFIHKPFLTNKSKLYYEVIKQDYVNKYYKNFLDNFNKLFTTFNVTHYQHPHSYPLENNKSKQVPVRGLLTTKWHQFKGKSGRNQIYCFDDNSIKTMFFMDFSTFKKHVNSIPEIIIKPSSRTLRA